jgi:hypothetical protein
MLDRPCWAPRVRVSHADADRVATLGGYIRVYTQGKECLFGMTVGHVRPLVKSKADHKSATSDTDDYDPGDSEGWPLEGENSTERLIDHCPDSATCNGAVGEDDNNHDTRGLPWSSLRKILNASSSYCARNGDWALIEVEDMQWNNPQTLRRLAPYKYAPAQRGEATEARIQNEPSNSGHLSHSPIILVMPFGNEFVHVYTIAMEDDTGKLHVD